MDQSLGPARVGQRVVDPLIEHGGVGLHRIELRLGGEDTEQIETHSPKKPGAVEGLEEGIGGIAGVRWVIGCDPRVLGDIVAQDARASRAALEVIGALSRVLAGTAADAEE